MVADANDRKEINQGNQSSLKVLMQELNLPILDSEKRRQGMLELEEPYTDEKFKGIVADLSKEDLEDDNFLTNCLLTRIVAIEDFDELKRLVSDLPELLAKKERIFLPDIKMVYEGIKIIREGGVNVGELSDIANSCIHSTTLENANADIAAGGFRPASAFKEGELRNSITHFRSNAPDKSHYDDYLKSGHTDFVFFSSTSYGDLIKQASTYSHGEVPVVFYTDKDTLAGLGLEQEYNASSFRYYSDVRIKGEVPVDTTKVIFTETKQLSQEQLSELQKVAKVEDLNVLAVIDLVAGLARYKDIDAISGVVSLFPRGKFVYKDSNFTSKDSVESSRTISEVSKIWRKFFKLDNN